MQHNIKEDSMVGKKLVRAGKQFTATYYQHYQLRKFGRASHSRYAIYLEDIKKKEEKVQVEDAKTILDSKMELKYQISELENTCKVLDEKFIKLVRSAKMEILV